MNKRILIIDDEHAIRMFLKDVFIRSGCTVTTASNGVDGLLLARGNGFDAIVTDMVMPDMEGVEMVGKLRTGGTDTPIVAITGYPDGGARLGELKDFCVDSVIYKPFLAREVLAAVEQAITNRKMTPMCGRIENEE